MIKQMKWQVVTGLLGLLLALGRWAKRRKHNPNADIIRVDIIVADDGNGDQIALRRRVRKAINEVMRERDLHWQSHNANGEGMVYKVRLDD